MSNKKSADSSSKKPPARDPTEFSVASTEAGRPFPPITSSQIHRSHPRYAHQDEEETAKPEPTLHFAADPEDRFAFSEEEAAITATAGGGLAAAAARQPAEPPPVTTTAAAAAFTSAIAAAGAETTLTPGAHFVPGPEGLQDHGDEPSHLATGTSPDSSGLDRADVRTVTAEAVTRDSLVNEVREELRDEIRQELQAQLRGTAVAAEVPKPPFWTRKRLLIASALLLIAAIAGVVIALVATRDSGEDNPSPTPPPTPQPTPAPTPQPTPAPTPLPTLSPRAALEAFYFATGGDNWDACFRGDSNPCTEGGITGTPWLATNDPCDWGGIRCNSQGAVTEIRLTFNGLRGSLPSEVAALSALVVLELWFNQLTGRLPESLGDLSNLAELYLFNNQLTGGIPESLGDLSNLVLLRLEDNMLTGSIPAAVCNDPSVTWITADAEICASSVSGCCRG